MALKGKIYSIARQHDDLNTNELFQSMIDKSAAQNTMVMDGRNIAVGSIFAEQIHSKAITADHIKSGAIETDHMDAGTIDVSVLKGSQLILPGANYGGVVINKDGLNMKSTGTAKLDIKLSSASGFNITDRFNNQLIDINPSTGNVIMEVNQLSIGEYSAATTKDIDDIEVGGRNLLLGSAGLNVSDYLNIYHIGGTRGIHTDTRVPSGNFLRISGYVTTGGAPSLYISGNNGRISRDMRNKQVTISMYVRGDSPFSMFDQEVGTSWTRVSSTFTFGTSNTHFYIRDEGQTVVDISSIQIETGNKATDWSIAPEDVEASYTAVAEAKAELERIKAEAYADDKVTAEEERAIQDAKNKLAEAKKHAEDKAGTAETNAKDYAKKQVDGIEVGGRNLIPNSTMSTNDGWVTSGDMVATSNGEIISITNTTGSYPRLNKIIDFEIEDNEEYTISFEARTDNPRNESVWLGENNGQTRSFNQSFNYGDKWNKYTHTFKAVSGTRAKGRNIRLQFWANPHLATVSKNLFLRNIKLEKGNKATDWTPATEDVEKAYTAVAEAKANLAEAQAKAHADGVVDDEEKRAIQEAKDKLAEAKKHADDKAGAAESNAKDHAGNLVDGITLGGRNLIVTYTSIPDTYIDSGTGLPVSSGVGAISTDWIKVEPSTEYIFTVPSSSGQNFDIGYFNSSQTFIKRDRFTGVSERVITTTGSTGYLRVSHPNLELAKLEKGNKATDWTESEEDRAYFASQMGTEQLVPGQPSHNSGGAMHNSNHGQYIEISEDILIGKTMINSSYNGQLIVQIREGHGAANTVLQEKTFTIKSGTQWLNLNFLLKKSEGTRYTLMAPARGGNLYRNQGGVSYPLDAGSFKMTSSIAGNAYYYYFHNLHVSGKGVVGEEYINNTATDAKEKTDAWSFNGTTKFDGTSIQTGTLTANQITTGILQDFNKTTRFDLTNGTFNIGSKFTYDGSTLSVNADSINLSGKVTFNDFNTSLKTTVNNKVTQSDVDSSISDIEVGGRNLLLNSAMERSGVAINDYLDYDLRKDIFIPLMGQPITISFDGKNDDGINQRTDIYFRDSSLGGSTLMQSSPFVLTNKYQRFSYTKILPNTLETYAPNNLQMRFRTNSFVPGGQNTNTGKISIKNIQIEKGNKATDWTPAPEDVESSYTAVAEAKANAAEEIATIFARTSAGKLVNTDPLFQSNSNGFTVYNNSNNGNVVVARAHLPAENAPGGNTFIMRIRSTGAASPNWGGFIRANNSRANAEFVIRFTAKIPSGRTVNEAKNAIGNGAQTKWLTSRTGTGTWQEYAYYYKCGSSGTFSNFGHVYLSGGSTPTTSAPLTWYVSKYEMIDISNSANPASRDDLKSSGSVIIHGGNIITDTLSADRITGRVPGGKITLDGDVTVNGTFKIGNGNINSGIEANKITTGTMHGNRITAGTLSANRINASTLSAITADLGTVTAGIVKGTNMNIDLSTGTYNSNNKVGTGLNYDSIEMKDGQITSIKRGNSGSENITKITSGALELTYGNPIYADEILTLTRDRIKIRDMVNGSERHVTIGAGGISSSHGFSIGGASIASRGSNGNGHWVKFYDGTQICWQRWSITGATSHSDGNGLWRSGHVNKNYAQSFTSAPSVTVGVINDWRMWFNADVNSNTAFRGVMFRAGGAINAAQSLDYIAIGRWK